MTMSPIPCRAIWAGCRQVYDLQPTRWNELEYSISKFKPYSIPS